MADAPQRILVVDDEEDIRVAIAAFLTSTFPHVEVVTANDGRKGLATLKAQEFDLLITDFKMPNMDGLQLVAAAVKAAPSVPRIMVTAFPDMDLAIHALNQGQIHHFLTKPLEPETLRDVVKALLAERRGRIQRDAALARGLDQMGKGKPDDKGRRP